MIRLLLLALFGSSQYYYCPWTELGFDTVNDIIEVSEGEITKKSRDSFCFDIKTEDSCMDFCSWSEGICIPDVMAQPSCYGVCSQVLVGVKPTSCNGMCVKDPL